MRPLVYTLIWLAKNILEYAFSLSTKDRLAAWENKLIRAFPMA
jgi:hypothetical protein